MPPRPLSHPRPHRNASLAHSCCAHRPRPPRYRSAPALGGAGSKRGAACEPLFFWLPPTSGSANFRREFAQTAGGAKRPLHTTYPPLRGRVPSCAKRREAGGGGKWTPKASMRRCGLPSTMQRPASHQTCPTHPQRGTQSCHHPGHKVTPVSTATPRLHIRAALTAPARLAIARHPPSGGRVVKEERRASRSSFGRRQRAAAQTLAGSLLKPQGARSVPSTSTYPPLRGRVPSGAKRREAGGGGEWTPKASMRRCGLPSTT